MAASMVKFSRRVFPPILARTVAPAWSLTQNRHYKKGTSKALREFYRRRLIVGPDKPRLRSEWVNWNYTAELYSFGKRLGEEFNDETLKTALIDSGYVEQELNRRKEVSSSNEPLTFNLESNEELAALGKGVANDYIKVFLHHHFPRLPAEGVNAITSYLMSRSVLANVGKHIGLYDIVLADSFPNDEVIERAFLAIIGSLAKDSGSDRAQRFVQDFLLPELIMKDINNLWRILDPISTLNKILEAEDRELSESRLLHSCGQETVMAAFTVGIYSDKELIGQGFGETVAIAEEQAANNALQRYFETELHNQQLNFEGAIADGSSSQQLEMS